MNPALALVIGQLLLQYGPTFVEALVKIFNNNNPTQADWDAAFALVKNPIAQVSDMPNGGVGSTQTLSGSPGAPR